MKGALWRRDEANVAITVGPAHEKGTACREVHRPKGSGIREMTKQTSTVWPQKG